MSPHSILRSTEQVPWTVLFHARSTRRPKRGFTLVETMIVVLILGILLSIAGLSVRRARMRARYTQCIANLKRIQGAKEQWALERNRPANAVPTNADLYGTGSYIVVEPTCPVNGTYNLRPVSQPPTCTIGGIWPHRID